MAEINHGRSNSKWRIYHNTLSAVIKYHRESFIEFENGKNYSVCFRFHGRILLQSFDYKTGKVQAKQFQSSFYITPKGLIHYLVNTVASGSFSRVPLYFFQPLLKP